MMFHFLHSCSSCFADSETSVTQLQTILLRFSYDYHGLPPRTRTALLSSAIYSVQLLQSSLCRNEVAMEILVKATITMVSHELQAISISKGNENERPSKLSVALLQVSQLNHTLIFSHHALALYFIN